ncbi:MAG: OmpA family protein [Planctomycetes bacterium]|nr:OmpA family protein [Planctomycetota bacterium]
MARRQPKPPEGAPEWMLTYGDMVTLLLCFFVLLFTMSEIKKDKITKTMRAFQRQFGVLPKYKATVQVFVQAQRMTQTEANVLRRGPMGEHPSVQTLVEDERLKVILGGKTIFEPQRAVLLPEGKQILRELSNDLRGYKNRIEVRGHTASAQYGPDMEYSDSWQLGYERAYTVMRYLVDVCKVDRRRFRVVSCGDTDPRDTNLNDDGRRRNRRVEIIMTEEFVKDMGEVDRSAK